MGTRGAGPLSGEDQISRRAPPIWICAALTALAVAAPSFADGRCQPCHAAQVEGYARTGMGNSMGRPAGPGGGEFSHARSRSKAFVTTGAGGMAHSIERGGLRGTYEAAYYIGSGNAGRSYIVQIANRLFQSPISYYSKRQAWDMSPGYEDDTEPDFNRPVSGDCLFCHSGKALPLTGTLNAYEEPPFLAEAISCDRCHGPTEEHLAKPARSNIVNPKRLPVRARDSVCEQCHLSGEARILNPGRAFTDFRPGMDLEEVFTVFTAGGEPKNFERPTIKVVSHSEQLAGSACYQASGDRLWCGSCHDPHAKPAEPASYYRERCLSCHTPEQMKGHPVATGDCISCHMPKRPAQDAPHTAFTDHRISRNGQTAKPRSSPEEVLRAWQAPNPPFQERNLGLAYISAGERDQSAYRLNEGFRLLAEIQPRFPDDPEVLTGLGLVLLRKNAPAEAARLFRRVVELRPKDAASRLNLAIAQYSGDEPLKAAGTLEKAITLDPYLEDAYGLLARIHHDSGRPDLERATMERYLAVMPQAIGIRQRLRRSP